MIRRLFRQMSMTQILTAMSTTLCLLIDSMVIGSLLGVDPMSAYGLASPVLIVFSAIGASKPLSSAMVFQLLKLYQ